MRDNQRVMMLLSLLGFWYIWLWLVYLVLLQKRLILWTILDLLKSNFSRFSCLVLFWFMWISGLWWLISLCSLFAGVWSCSRGTCKLSESQSHMILVFKVCFARKKYWTWWSRALSQEKLISLRDSLCFRLIVDWNDHTHAGEMEMEGWQICSRYTYRCSLTRNSREREKLGLVLRDSLWNCFKFGCA